MSLQTYNTDKPCEVPGKIRARGYQLEMLEESFKKNIIVAMDTGSGKTQIAVLRIMAELDRCAPDKLVWFLAPTVALCKQQYDIISLQLAAVRTKLLIGSDNVDRWSERRIWDSALKDVQVVVSTHAVLADALTHGFVRIKRLALLIFDEAHHCARKHPANRIMCDFYHPELKKLGRSAVPNILGLTASPIMRSKPSELRIIEANLDSISRTPRVQRQEMLQYVHRPVLRRLDYHPLEVNGSAYVTYALKSLISVGEKMDVLMDSGVSKLKSDTKSLEDFEKTLSTGKTYWRGQLKKFRETVKHIYEELGRWAVDYFVAESVNKVRRAVNAGKDTGLGWENDEKAYLLQELSEVAPTGVKTDFTVLESPQISPKVERLISFLAEEDHPEFSGLLFVRRRATVSVLSTLLSIHPKTRNRFQCAPYVGLSNSASGKWNMCELLDIREQRETLTHFRDGQKNLIIATDVLEEGIDIPICHLVICFDSPSNLKSFVQRRGRARQKESTFAIMAPDNDTSVSFDRWKELEEEMIRIYQDDARQLQEVSTLESTPEDVPDRFEVESTGAILTAETAIVHLHHFCAQLPPQPYVDLHPVFTFRGEAGTDLVIGLVTLPNCVSSSVRCTVGCRSWITERAAMKDAAFQACVALHRVGLLNDHFLPLKHERIMKITEVELARVIEIPGQFDPWVVIAKRWPLQDLHQIVVTIEKKKGDGEENFSMLLTLPMTMPSRRPFSVYWDSRTMYTIRFEKSCRISAISPDGIQLMREISHIILRSICSDHKPDDRKDFVVLFGPDVKDDHFLTWLTANRGRRPALEEYYLHRDRSSRGLVRSTLTFGNRYIFNRWRNSSPNGAQEEIEVECSPLLKRRNFLCRGTVPDGSIDLPGKENDDSPKVHRFPANTCTVDMLPFEQGRLSLFIRPTLQYLEVLMVASELRKTIIKDVPFKKIDHVMTAISASSAHWVNDYQRFEFLGDSILKFVISNQLFADHRNWHEGYLSQRRASLVSNSCLARAALDAGLEPFILTKSLASRKWTVPFISEVEKCAENRRHISSKVLADVVEALIGAAFVDGGLPASRACIHTFLPVVRTQPPNFKPIASDTSCGTASVNPSIERKEKLLIGHTFVNKDLLTEALTHGSCERDALTLSYQRLEFLGDAVLDMVVVSALLESNPDLSHGDMSLIKAALVNADFLAFLCMELSLEDPTTSIQQKANGEFYEVQGKERIELWMFMRHHSQEITRSQQKCRERHQRLREEVNRCLRQGESHPWALLAQLNADKYYSDLVESVLGAIFVDSGGNLPGCRRFAEHIGILPYLRRVVTAGVDTIHPTSALDRLKGPEKIEYVVASGDPIQGLYRCLVRICDVDIVTVEGCLSRDEAMTRAAQAVLDSISILERNSHINESGNSA